MLDGFEREAPTNSPQNHNSANPLVNDQNVRCDNQNGEEPKKEKNSHIALVNQNSAERDWTNSEQLLIKINQIMGKKDKRQEDYVAVEMLVSQHIMPLIHPVSSSGVGSILLQNGKFIVFYIEVMTRHEKKDYLKKYLFNYFSELDNISSENRYFHEAKGKQGEKIAVSRRGKSKSKRVQLLKGKTIGEVSGSSSKQCIDQSIVTENDLSSPLLVHQLTASNNLKRDKIIVSELTNEKNERSQKMKNIKKDGKISNQKPTKLKMSSNKSSTKRNQSQKKTKSKPFTKNDQKTGQKISQSNKIQEKAKNLGSCYHYLVSVNPKYRHKQLKQVRTSARLSKKKQKGSIEKRKSLRICSESKKIPPTNTNIAQTQQLEKKSESASNQYIVDVLDSSISNYSIDSQQNVDWIKNHLKELEVKDVQLYSDFKALTNNDQKITDFLLEIENSQEANHQANNLNDNTITIVHHIQKSPEKEKQVLQQEIGESQECHQAQSSQVDKCEQTEQPQHQQERAKNFTQIREEYQIRQLPITIESIVDADLNSHGIYAFVKLGRVTELEMGTAYAVSPLTYGNMANRRHIKEDLQKAKELAGEYGENIGYIPMSQQLLEMIKKKINEQ